jgi:hypothetical protein
MWLEVVILYKQYIPIIIIIIIIVVIIIILLCVSIPINL